MSIYKLTAYDLKCTKVTNGNYYVTTDTKQVFYDQNNIRTIKSVRMIATERERLNNVSPINGSLYYVWETNTLWTYNSKWIVLEGNYSSNPSGYYYNDNVISPNTNDPNAVLDNNGLLGDGSVVVRDSNRVIKGKLSISQGNAVVRYVLLTDEPDDWSTNYQDYFIYDDGEYKPNTSSTWATDTYYYEETVFESVNDLIIASFLGGGIKLLPSGDADSTGALQIFSANTYTGEHDGSGNPIITGNNGELVFWGDMYVTDGITRWKLLTSIDGYTYVAGTGIQLGLTDYYFLLEAKPSNWDTNYTDYYKIVSDEYVQNDIATWAEDTFYIKEQVPNSIAVEDYNLILKDVKINGVSLAHSGSSVDIPIAGTSTLGVIKVGANLTIDPDGTLNAQAGGGGATIDDSTVALDKTWSSDKISDELSNKADTGDIPTDVSDLNNDAGYTVVSFTQLQLSGTKITEIDIDGTVTEIYAPTGGGGSSTLAGLTDVTLTTPANNQILRYNNGVWENSNDRLPATTSADENKFLTIDASGNIVATTISAWNGGSF